MINKWQLVLLLTVVCVFENCNDRPGEQTKVTNDKKPAQDSVILPTDPAVTDTLKKSLPAVADAEINGKKITIRYHSPGVRNRVIWGGLVPYDQVWVTGAHLATSIESSGDMIINGKTIPAGKYALFTIPGKEQWTVILNKNWQQHLTDEYNASDDIVRLNVNPEAAPHQERLMYSIAQNDGGRHVIEMKWEKISIRVPFEFAN
ncbi:MAG TPA: DUF2911 domain-containing protein [Chitinophagaceae bacterium]